MGGTSSKKRQRDPGCVEDGLGAKKTGRPHSNQRASEENVEFELESSEEVPRSFRRKRRYEFHRLVDYPMVDYSNVTPKVDCWRRKVCSSMMAEKISADVEKEQTENKKGKCCGCFPCSRRRKPKNTTLPVPGDTDGHVDDINCESSDTGTRFTRRHRRTSFHHLVEYPMEDYSKIPPKVDCWRKKSEFGGNDTENKHISSPTIMSSSEEKELRK